MDGEAEGNQAVLAWTVGDWMVIDSIVKWSMEGAARELHYGMLEMACEVRVAGWKAATERHRFVASDPTQIWPPEDAYIDVDLPESKWLWLVVRLTLFAWIADNESDDTRNRASILAGRLKERISAQT